MPDVQRILIVDNDEHVLFVLSHALSRLGDQYEVVTSADGRTALAETQRSHIDLLVTEVLLPELDGIELTRAVHREAEDLPVIWVTGHAGRLVQRKAIELGVHVVMEKPVEVAMLREIARSAIQEQYQREGEIQMDEHTRKITSWANRGTLRQFATELSARLEDEDEYQVQVMDNVLQVHRAGQEGGVLGLGGEDKQELVLEVVDQGSGLAVRELSADQELVAFLADTLQRH
jgi:CheY-like chemotaxis protein